MSPCPLHALLLITQSLVLPLWRMESEVFMRAPPFPSTPTPVPHVSSQENVNARRPSVFKLICFHVCGLLDEKNKIKITNPSICRASFSPKTKERFKRTEGSPCQACGVMIYLGKILSPASFCHLPSALNWRTPPSRVGALHWVTAVRSAQDKRGGEVISCVCAFFCITLGKIAAGRQFGSGTFEGETNGG